MRLSPGVALTGLAVLTVVPLAMYMKAQGMISTVWSLEQEGRPHPPRNTSGFSGVILPFAHLTYRLVGSLVMAGTSNPAYEVEIHWGDDAVDVVSHVYNFDTVLNVTHTYPREEAKFRVGITVRLAGWRKMKHPPAAVELDSGPLLSTGKGAMVREGNDCRMFCGELNEDASLTTMAQYFIMQHCDAANLLLSHMAASTHYLEFGSGGSSYMATALPTLTTAVTVENDRGFLEFVKSKPVAAPALAAGRWIPLWINTGNITAFGHPTDRLMVDQWPNYPKAGDRWGPGFFGTILVDGRFRVACAARSLELLAPGGYTLVHDYSRSDYHAVEKWFDVLQVVERLAEAQPKEGITRVPESDIPWLSKAR